MNQTQAQTNPYLRTKVLTASPEQLRLMLFDGAIKFCRQARHCLGQTDYEGMYNALVRAQRIMLELSTSLDHAADPQLCQRLAALYDYIYRRLVDANIERDAAAIDEALELIEYERETWVMLMKNLADQSEGGQENPPPTDRPAEPDASVLASIGPNASHERSGANQGDNDSPGGFSAEG